MEKMLSQHEKTAVPHLHTRYDDFAYLAEQPSCDDAVAGLKIGQPGEGFQLLRNAALYELAALLHPFLSRVVKLAKAIYLRGTCPPDSVTLHASQLVSEMRRDPQITYLNDALQHTKNMLDVAIKAEDETIFAPCSDINEDLASQVEDVVTLGMAINRLPKGTSLDAWLAIPAKANYLGVSDEQRAVERRAWNRLAGTSCEHEVDEEFEPGAYFAASEEELDECMDDLRATMLLGRYHDVREAVGDVLGCGELIHD